MSNGPLAGVRVFDLTQWMVGPWCSVQLGALGAEVIHIEQPDVDWSTLGAGVPPLINGTSVGYIAWNMNKRGLSLAMKSPEDRAVAYELLKTSDVFLINMRPDVAERLGVGYDVVSGINPNIIYCAITGWGESGPMRDSPGADTPAQYVTGFSTGTGTPEGDDEIPPPFHPAGRDQWQLRRAGDPDGPRGPQAHRQGPAHPRLDAEGGLGAADRAHRRVPRQRQAAAAARLRLAEHGAEPRLPLRGRRDPRRLRHQRGGVAGLLRGDRAARTRRRPALQRQRRPRGPSRGARRPAGAGPRRDGARLLG